jgi:4-carboxymuconolactone decarboxylase
VRGHRFDYRAPRQDIREATMRIKRISPDEMNTEQKEVYDANVKSKRGRMPAPVHAWIRSPQMAKRMEPLGEFLRYDASLGARLSEIAILVTARHWTAHFEWYAHKRLGLEAGLDPQVISDIAARHTPDFKGDAKAQVTYEVSKALHEDHKLATPLYERAIAALGEKGLVELIGLLGYYCLVSMTLNTFEFDLPEGEKSDLA